jgi:hypothetical protein
MEPEAVLLPHHAQILDSEAIDLGWARGRRFTLEVYASAAEGGETKAPVTSVEIHVLLTVDREEERLALDFYASAPCSEGLREVELTLQEMIDSAVLANVAESASPMMDEALTADWQVFEDEGYGFSLRFPQDWAYKEVATEGPGMPEDWPLERSVAFFPRAWAERFEQSGPPDPEAPPAVPAPGLEVYVGSEQAFRRAVIEPTASDVLEVNGTEVIREVDAVNQTCQLIRYVFQHPDREDVRIVLTDALTGFEERLEGNRDVAEILSTIVATFEFQD